MSSTGFLNYIIKYSLMKHFHMILSLSAAAMCMPTNNYSQNAENATADTDDLLILTFEDADFKGDLKKIPYLPDGVTASSYWTSLIDDKQYNGSQLYSEDDVPYIWYDQNNTDLSGGINEMYETYQFWNGGSAISNYVMATYIGASFTTQLSAYNPTGGKGGYNNSDNFLVCFGYQDESGFGMGGPAELTFRTADGEPAYTYINLSAYGLNSALVGDGFNPVAGPEDWVDITAEPLDANGNSLGTKARIRLIDGADNVTTQWKKWDLSGLGKCRKIRFNVESSMQGDYGLSFPAYFLLDNFAVRDQSTGAVQNVAVDNSEDTIDKGIYTIYGVRIDKITHPGLYIINGKKILVK